MKLNHLYAAGAMLLALGAFVACSDKETTEPEGETVPHILEVTCDSPTELADTGGEVVFTIKSNTEWHVTSSSAWAVPSKTKSRANGTVKINVGDNPALSARTATITISDCMDYNWDGVIDENDLREGDIGFQTFQITQKGGELTKPNVDIYDKVVFDWLVDGTAVGYNVAPSELTVTTVPGKYLKASRNSRTGRYSAYFGPTDKNGGDVAHGTASYNGYYHSKFEDTPIAETMADGFSAEFYFRPDFDFDGSVEVKPFSCMQAGGWGFMFSKSTSNGGGNFCVILDSVDGGKAAWRYVSCGFVPKKDEWYHSVYVYDNAVGMEYLYMNGELAGTAEVPGTYKQPNAKAGYFMVGGDPAANDGASCTAAFKGDIGIARVYSEPMTAAQAAALYKCLK